MDNNWQGSWQSFTSMAGQVSLVVLKYTIAPPPLLVPVYALWLGAKYTVVHIPDIITYIAQKTNDAAVWTYDNVLVPMGPVIEKGAYMLKDGAVYTANEVGDVVGWTYGNVLVPMGSMIEKGAYMLKDGAVYTANEVGGVVGWTYGNVLVPTGPVIEKGAYMLKDEMVHTYNTILSVGSSTYEAVVNILHEVQAVHSGV